MSRHLSDNSRFEKLKVGDGLERDPHTWTLGAVRLLIQLLDQPSTSVEMASAAIYTLAMIDTNRWHDDAELESIDASRFTRTAEGVLLRAASGSVTELAMLRLYRVGLGCTKLRRSFLASAAVMLPRALEAFSTDNIGAEDDPCNNRSAEHINQLVRTCKVRCLSASKRRNVRSRWVFFISICRPASY